jgi:uptake hydrogenase large subunit
MGLEGELRIGLRVRDARIERIGITSTRPDVARSLLQGRTRAEAVAAVPQLFSICAHSQAAAATLACAAAAGEAASDDRLANDAASVCAEMVREYAWRTLLEAPREIGETPGDDAIAAARASLTFHCAAPVGPHTGDVAHTIALAAFGVGADEWLALGTLRELDRWAAAGHTATARFIRKLRDDDAAAGRHGAGGNAGDPALLEGRHHAAWIGELAEACAADPEFARLPSWRGAPAETGALARLQSDSLIAEFSSESASRVPARFVARLRELSLLLAGRSTALVGARTLPSGSGIAWVENARGLLIHLVQLDQGRVRSYRIVAPTEWNFHPGGALASALLGTAAADLDAVQHRAALVVNSLDPCVDCRVEFDHA